MNGYAASRRHSAFVALALQPRWPNLVSGRGDHGVRMCLEGRMPPPFVKWVLYRFMRSVADDLRDNTRDADAALTAEERVDRAFRLAVGPRAVDGGHTRGDGASSRRDPVRASREQPPVVGAPLRPHV